MPALGVAIGEWLKRLVQPPRYYVVRSGDTLSGIASYHYGDPQKFNTIFNANRDLISDPNKIQPGQRLRIPYI